MLLQQPSFRCSRLIPQKINRGASITKQRSHHEKKTFLKHLRFTLPKQGISNKTKKVISRNNLLGGVNRSKLFPVDKTDSRYCLITRILRWRFALNVQAKKGGTLCGCSWSKRLYLTLPCHQTFPITGHFQSTVAIVKHSNEPTLRGFLQSCWACWWDPKKVKTAVDVCLNIT